ncbi:unnamed protein product [Darwinula stevensoni]|uniref:Major facilitator superfamily (MFS) profile domain-containing protein n=1 Tax=Darwinula stevensoni TaxID=69355 RepID=A0A7R9AGR7_9CRUS|nr:unnamed protein product [Darwinula stevensoni]CAG0903984.1 unnamed protein product [Darwinula stevensoni]
MAIGTTFMTSVAAGILSDWWDLRKTAIAGAIIASLGMFLSSFVYRKVGFLCTTYGLLFGVGSSLVYTPSLVILNHYFSRRRGMVNGLVSAGSSVFTILMPFLLGNAISGLGLANTFRLLSGFTLIMVLCSTSFRPQLGRCRSMQEDTRGLRMWFRTRIWRDLRFIIWIVSMPLGLLGYFVPYVHLVQYVKDTIPDADGKWLMLCIGITSGMGKIVFGKISDIPWVNRVILQQVSFVALGTLTMVIPFVASFPALICITLVFGLFDGGLISLLGPIAYDICGPDGVSQGIGSVLALCSIPLMVGPPIAGALYEMSGSYEMAFLMAGGPPLIGALGLGLIQCIKQKPTLRASQTAETTISALDDPLYALDIRDLGPLSTQVQQMLP